MKIATLAIIVRDNKVLLGYKKKGEIGGGTLNGPGGKVEQGESLVECLVRETREELGIELDHSRLNEIAVITFHVDGTPDFKVHIFLTGAFSGTPVETDDMVPGWYDLDNLPLDRMLESDREWFSKAAKGEKFRANAFYRKRASDFDRIEFFSY